MFKKDHFDFEDSKVLFYKWAEFDGCAMVQARNDKNLTADN